MNHTKTTLGELLSHANEIIRRNAMSILKQLQGMPDEAQKCVICGDNIYGLVQVHHHNEKCKKCGYEIIGTQPHDCKK